MIDSARIVVADWYHSDTHRDRTWILQWPGGDSTAMTEDEACQLAFALREMPCVHLRNHRLGAGRRFCSDECARCDDGMGANLGFTCARCTAEINATQADALLKKEREERAADHTAWFNNTEAVRSENAALRVLLRRALVDLEELPIDTETYNQTEPLREDIRKAIGSPLPP